jgi:hypothetical protein
VWQALREELHPKGFELVTVGLDTLGAEGCRSFIEAARPRHPSLIDAHHVMAELFGVINIPQSVWIDEQGMIVRPPETAPAPPGADRTPRVPPDVQVPERFQAIMGEAQKIRQDVEPYHTALRDWVDHGADSRYALPADEVIARSRPRDADVARGHAHFELACELERRGHHDNAVEHFREAHRLVPESWTFRRQAWSLEQAIDGPLARFWQGPPPDAPQRWPYEGDWLADIREIGAENYYERWRP